MDKDLVRAILDQVLEMSRRAGGSFDESMALQIERQVRNEYGGDEVYIKRTAIREERKARALEEAKKTGRPVEAASRHGISRATMYRLLKR
jgi:transcriptional regulator of acetoin/glycerol metabolism